MKKISLLLTALLLGAQCDINTAAAAAETPAEREARELEEAIAASLMDQGSAADALTEEELAQVAEAEAIAKAEEEAQFQRDLAQALAASQIKMSFAEEFKNAALKRQNTLAPLAKGGGFKEGRGEGPPIKPKPQIKKKPIPRPRVSTTEIDLPPPPQDWLDDLDGGDA